MANSFAARPSTSSRAWHNWPGSNPRPFFLQLAIDVLAVAFGAFFICATACSVPLALFLLIFCQL